MYGLNIHLKSFKLDPSIISGNDKIRVSITTLPEKNKEAFVIEAKQMKFVHHFFTINITEKTDRIIFVIRKIGFFEDPIIASTMIFSKDFPSGRSINTDTKTFLIYEPLQNNNNNNKNNILNKTRKVYGDMQVELSLTSAFPTFKSKENNKNNNKVQSYSKSNTYSKVNHENQYRNNSIFSNYECN